MIPFQAQHFRQCLQDAKKNGMHDFIHIDLFEIIIIKIHFIINLDGKQFLVSSFTLKVLNLTTSLNGTICVSKCVHNPVCNVNNILFTSCLFLLPLQWKYSQYSKFLQNTYIMVTLVSYISQKT